MAVLQPSHTGSPMRASTSKTQGLDELDYIAVRLALAPKQQLFSETEPADNLFKVTEGVLKAYKLLPDGRCQVTGFLFPGDLLGIEFSGTYAYSVDAVTRATVAGYRSQAFQRLIERDPELEHWLLNVVGHELSVAQDQMLLLGRETAQERIAAFLLLLSERAVARGEADNPVYVPMPCVDIGDYLGLAAETVSRIYGRLYRRGIISRRTTGEVQILDREALSKIRKRSSLTPAPATPVETLTTV